MVSAGRTHIMHCMRYLGAHPVHVAAAFLHVVHVRPVAWNAKTPDHAVVKTQD
jgi:hypothetical protein